MDSGAQGTFAASPSPALLLAGGPSRDEVALRAGGVADSEMKGDVKKNGGAMAALCDAA
eukprot:IDg8620t1